MKKLLFISLLLTQSIFLMAQGPSLSAGVGKIVYNKGQLDADLIMNIVATKQAEIKSEFAKRLILNQFECGSFAMYNYVRQNTNMLLNNTDKDALKKEILKSSAELALVYGISEFYLQNLARKSKILAKKNQFLSEHEQMFLYKMIKWSDSSTLILKENKFYYLLPSNSKTIKGGYNTDFIAMDTIYNNKKYLDSKPPSNYLKNLVLLPLFSNPSPEFSEAIKWGQSDCNYIAPAHIFVDMVYDICIRNKELKAAGFFNNISIDSASYELRNKYLRFRPDSAMNNVYEAYNGVRNEINDLITALFTFYGTLREFSEFQKSSAPPVNSPFKVVPLKVDSLGIEAYLSSINAYYNYVIGKDIDVTKLEWIDIIKSIRKEIEIGIPPESKYFIDNKDQLVLNEIFQLLGKNKPEEGLGLNNYQFDLSKYILPKIRQLSINTNGKFDQLINSLEELELYLKYKSGKELISFIKNSKLDSLNVVELSDVIKMLDLLRNLDEVETYDYFFKFLLGTIGTIGNNKTKSIVQKITTNFDRYSIINKDDNQIDIKVEDIALDLYKKYGENNSARFGMYFTVGVNYSLRSKNGAYVIGNDTLWRGNTANFVSEKIGLRYNLADWNRKYSLNNYNYRNATNKEAFRRSRRSQQQPMINSLAAFTYFSGLLYQVEFLNSEDQGFNQPTIGAGITTSFFNGLDFNVSYAMPFNTNISNGFWNLGFDIRFTEYLGQLKQKNSQK